MQFYLPVAFFILDPNTLLSTKLCSSLAVRDQVSHPSKTTGKIKVFHMLIFIYIYIYIRVCVCVCLCVCLH